MNLLSPIVGFLFALVGDPLPDISPPIVDYCSEMAQEIQGKKHGFLAGNKTYYIGGFHPVWNIQEHETIGFTHPFFNDLRGRGHGLVSHPQTGYGHDLTGWEFYKNTKIAYGSVIIDGVRYEHPIPTSMVWRPDRLICEYDVNGVIIREEKFIDLNDTLCSIITSDQPIIIEFEGHSFADNQTTLTNASCQIDIANNCIHIIEGGESEAVPIRTNGVNVTQIGPIMYDEMSTVISASRNIEDFTNVDIQGQQNYSFSLPCDSNSLSLVWAMDDEYSEALVDINNLLSDPHLAKLNKTDYINDILNQQIPYFRCSDQDIVDIYYYLWALQIMYMIDLDEGFEQYPHTQTAVHNFLGVHRFDANFQIQVGSWAADKSTYANGNVLVWKALLPFSNLQTGRIPADNMGKTWYSGLEGSLAGHVVGAWKIYEHSGDEEFLQEAYTFYRELMWNAIPGIWGYQYKAADCLSKMAMILGYPEDEKEHWPALVNASNVTNFLDNMWQKNGVTNYFGAGEQNNPDKPQWRRKGWNAFSYLAMDDFPHEWARLMTEHWALNEDYGFNLNGHFTTTAQIDWDLVANKNFMITPDAHWFALIGMYKQHVADHANTLTLHHLKNYNLKWGIPIAPEAMKETLELHGDQYSNFNAGKILLILEGIFGLSYSVIDNVFSVAEHMPDEWSFMETYVPITEDGRKYWTHVRVEKQDENGTQSRTVEVNGNRMDKLLIEPWINNKSLVESTPGFVNNESSGNITYEFNNSLSGKIEIALTNTAEMVSEENIETNNFIFNEDFSVNSLDTNWEQLGNSHIGLTNGFYRFSDIHDSSATELKRSYSTDNNAISSTLIVELGPFMSTNTKSDFKWGIYGNNGSLMITLNSYGRLQLRHNAYGDGDYLLNEIIDIGYIDNERLKFNLSYDSDNGILNISFQIADNSPTIIYQGTGLNDNGFEDIYSSQTTVKLFKFNNEPSDQPIVAIDSWNISVN